MVTYSRRKRRDRQSTEQRILEAAGRVLARSGFRSLGVNAVAREAGTDKVLLYRYFGGMEGLLDAFARSVEFWPSDEELMPDDPGAGRAAKAAVMLARLAAGLRRRPATQNILAWELIEPNPLAERTAEARERAGLRLMAMFPPETAPGRDLPAVAALLTAGVTYLVLRSRTAPEWLGVSLRDEQGWARLLRAGESLIRALMADATSDGSPPLAGSPPKRRSR